MNFQHELENYKKNIVVIYRMAYQDNPAKEATMQNRIHSILMKKSMDPLYDGRGLSDSRIYNIVDQMNQQPFVPGPCVGKKYCTGYNWKGRRKPSMYGYGIMEYSEKKYKKKKNAKRVQSGKSAYKKNKWMTFLKQWRKAHPNVNGSEVLRRAAVDYKSRS
jgi:hypothetical protein